MSLCMGSHHEGLDLDHRYDWFKHLSQSIEFYNKLHHCSTNSENYFTWALGIRNNILKNSLITKSQCLLSSFKIINSHNMSPSNDRQH